MFKAFFKKAEITAEQLEELCDANVALRVRMDKILFMSTVKHATVAKPTRPVFEGRIAA
jgi:hypothetical protein